LSDEQDIRKLVMGIFKDLWFRAATSSEDELPPDATKALASFTISNRMDQVIEVVSGIHSDTPALWLTELILGVRCGVRLSCAAPALTKRDRVAPKR
jgi:hypothetical protein